MDLSTEIKEQYLEVALKAATLIENTDKVIFPHKSVSEVNRRRIGSISHEIYDISQHSQESKGKRRSIRKLEKSTHREEIVKDSPTLKTKKILTKSIRDINRRVCLSRSGKRMVGPLINSPLIPSQFAEVPAFFSKTRKLSRRHEDRPMPYVSLTSGKVEPPILLPTYNEYLHQSGVKYIVGSESEELLYRIDEAIKQLLTIRPKLDKLKSPDKMSYRKRVGKKYTEKTRNYKQKLKKLFTPEPISNHGKSRNSDGLLEDTFRNFFVTKATENQKLEDIIEKMNENRAISVQTKAKLIIKDKERFKNQQHAISKFDSFRKVVEDKKRKRLHESYEQAISYMKLLESFKTKKHQPKSGELLVLQVWKTCVEKGWVIGPSEFSTIVSSLRDNEKNDPDLQSLISSLQKSLKI